MEAIIFFCIINCYSIDYRHCEKLQIPIELHSMLGWASKNKQKTILNNKFAELRFAFICWLLLAHTNIRMPSFDRISLTHFSFICYENICSLFLRNFYLELTNFEIEAWVHKMFITRNNDYIIKRHLSVTGRAMTFSWRISWTNFSFVGSLTFFFLAFCKSQQQSTHFEAFFLCVYYTHCTRKLFFPMTPKNFL